MADVASKQQTTVFFYPPWSHEQEDKQNWQKKLKTWWEICAVAKNIQTSFSCSFFYTVKLHSLT
jgi:hypothetical protein